VGKIKLKNNIYHGKYVGYFYIFVMNQKIEEMKKVFLSMFLLTGLVVSSCSGEAKSENVTYLVDSDATSLEWTGHYLIGEAVDHSHTGTVRVSEGTIIMNGDELVEGVFTLDMTTLDEPNPMSEEMGQKFIGHMVSGDFFNTSEFPKATFTLKALDDKGMRGTVSMLDTKMDVDFPVKMEKTESGMTVKGTFSLDIAVLNLPGMGVDPENPEQRISPSVDFNLNLVMKK